MPLLRRVPLPVLPLAVAAVVLLGAGAASAGGPASAPAAPVPVTTTAAWPTLCLGNLNPPGFELQHYWHHTCGHCHTAGAAGVADGRWLEYRCVAAPVGLDIAYPLYVRR